jgi:hypothetical protein
MGAARLAYAQIARDPNAKQYLIDHHAYQRQIQEIKEKAAAELNESRRQFTAQLVTTHRELTALRAAVEALRSANADLQQKLQEQDATVKSFREINVDLQQQLRSLRQYQKIARRGRPRRRAMKTMNRHELRQIMMKALDKTQRRNDPQVVAVVETFVDQLVQLNDEHAKQVAMLKAMFDAGVDSVRRESDALKMELNAHKANGVDSNVVPLRRRDDDDRPFPW